MINKYRNQYPDIMSEKLITNFVRAGISRPDSWNFAIKLGIIYRRKTIQKIGMSAWMIIVKIVDLIILLKSFV
jgi:hypothetical protein